MVFNGTLVLMEALMHQKKTDINFSKSKKKFYLSLHYNSDQLLICKWKRNL